MTTIGEAPTTMTAAVPPSITAEGAGRQPYCDHRRAYSHGRYDRLPPHADRCSGGYEVDGRPADDGRFGRHPEGDHSSRGVHLREKEREPHSRDGQFDDRSSNGRHGKGGGGRRGSKMIWGEHKITLENVPMDMVGLELKELAEGFGWKSLTFARTYRRGGINFGMLFTDRGDMENALRTFDGRVIEGSHAKLRVYEGDNYNM
eukprot:CAMPEP_0179265708 /NCGR_PEP_ID=MMETSP0797-20121207/29042_1 /TAXON_ID=47934 /ORGANISM="Dinophysis acuminata, Strain DAEP01" /LENGTH=202 /DNA_ID=CAMNT_0020973923 /DNA_START=33 /DNA_END=641 /DNA_ORIENTATION=+